MIVIPTPIPIMIHPLFWAMAALIGWLYSGGQGWMWIAIWIGIVFVSVLFHELGHALTAALFRQKARIQLMVLGGVTSYDGPKLSFKKQFLIVLNGPLFGFLLAYAAYLIAPQIQSPVLYAALTFTWKANLFWSVANLLPVLPLDGGQLLRVTLEGFFGIKGFRASLLLGATFSVLLALYVFTLHMFLLGAFLFLFAFQSYDGWRKSRYATTSDRDDTYRQLLVKAELLLQQGKKQDAKQVLQQIKEQTKQGLLADTASQYLAFLLVDEGQKDQAYELLTPIEEHLAEDASCLLHKLAVEKKDYALVSRLAAGCYQHAPSQEMALNNARAFAYLNQPKPAGGWLQTAYQYGGIDLQALLLEEEFAALKEHKEFRAFVDALQK